MVRARSKFDLERIDGVACMPSSQTSPTTWRDAADNKTNAGRGLRRGRPSRRMNHEDGALVDRDGIPVHTFSVGPSLFTPGENRSAASDGVTKGEHR